MADRKKMSEFDYQAAELDAKNRLEQSPPTAIVPHPDGMGATDVVLPLRVQEAIQFLFVLADRDAATDDAQSGQLKHEIRGHMTHTFEEGAGFGAKATLEYIKAIREGAIVPSFYFEDDADLLDGLLGGIEASDAAVDDEVSFEEILADLKAREEG